jgi:predicted DsbA family dithiol-disulfide isomerase
MQLDVISDPICPWCYIGLRNLDEALRRHPIADLEIRWRPFMLDPSIPPDGIERKTYYESRFGSEDRISQGAEQAAQLGAKVGIAFAFDKIKRVPNTLDAHRLIRWASAEGQAGPALSQLFGAYFERGLDIGDRSQLAEIAASCGLDGQSIAERLTTEEDIAAILDEDRAVRALGINGVPCLLIDQKYALMGAQDPANLVGVFERIEAHETP